MDLGLKLLHAKSLIKKTQWRIKLTRQELEEKRPHAIAFIEGANDVEKDLDKLEIAIDHLELELRMQGRDLNYATKVNAELKQRIQDLEHEIKFKNVEL